MIRRIYNRLRTSGIRCVDGSLHLVWCRLWLRWRYGYQLGHYTLWGAYRWTRGAARRDLMEAMCATERS